MGIFNHIISSECVRCFHEENYQIEVRDYFDCDGHYNCTFGFELDTLHTKNAMLQNF